MQQWYKNVQELVDEIDLCIRERKDENLTLQHLARHLGYTESYISRKFAQVAGMRLRDYLRYRKLAFALKELRDTRRSILEIAVEFGFSSHESFTRAFRDAYGITPSQYRRNPVPVVLRTLLRPMDCYLLETGTAGKLGGAREIKTYFVRIPAHKFLHIRNYESIGYWDFWRRQNLIPGQDCETICGLLDSIPYKLDDAGGGEPNSSSGQVMAFLNDPAGRICSWGIPLAECYGVRLPPEYDGPVPGQMLLSDIPEGEYLVFEHGPFDFATENSAVEAAMEQAMKEFDWGSSGYRLDTTPGRIFYFYHDGSRFWKYIRPVCRV